MLAWYRVPFVQGLFPLVLGFVNFVLNLTWIAFWWWYALVTVKRRGKMVLICNMLGYVKKFADVFEQPGLAPHRALDHAIDLIDENAPSPRHK